MRRETALGLDVRLLEPADGELRGSDVFQNIGLLASVRVQRVVRLMPRLLQCNERLGEVADFHRELPHRLPLPTRAPGPAMLQCAIRPMPRRAAHRADEQIGRRRKAVEHRVVRGADGVANFTRGAGGSPLVASLRPVSFRFIPPGPETAATRAGKRHRRASSRQASAGWKRRAGKRQARPRLPGPQRQGRHRRAVARASRQ